MAEEESAEVLDDLRKKRLAYFQSKPESPSNHPGQNTESNQDKYDITQNGSLSKSNLPSITQQLQQVDSVQTPVPNYRTEMSSKSNSAANAFSGSNKTDSSLNKSFRDIKTESGSHGNISAAHSNSAPLYEKKAENVVESVTPEIGLSKTLPSGSELDGYNETVERLIRATKEELLGKKSSDDIWQRIRKTSESDISVKSVENENHIKFSRELTKDFPKDYHNISDSVNQRGEESVQLEGHQNVSMSETNTILFNADNCQYTQSEKNQQIVDAPCYPVQGNVHENSRTWKDYYQDNRDVPFKVKSEFEPSFTKQMGKFEENRQSYDSAKVEEIFSSRQNPWSQIPNMHLNLQESRDLEVVSEKKIEESLDMSDLGLSTHRPDVETDSNRESVQASDLNLGDTITNELRTVLGEDKFQEFLNKAKRDIDDLHETRSDRSLRKEKTPRLMKENKPIGTQTKPTAREETSSGQKQSTDKGRPSSAVKEDRKSKSFQRQTSEPCKPSKIGQEPTLKKTMRQVSSVDVGDKQAILSNRSTDFTPRVPDSEAVASMIGEYILDTKSTKESNTPSPILKADVSLDSSGSHSSRLVPELNLSEINKSDSPRLTKLNRPKHEPFNIYQDKSQSQDIKRSAGESSRPDSSLSYEQVPVQKNVVFSADEIYSQAYGSLYHSHPDVQAMSPHVASSFNDSLQYSLQSPGPSSVNGPPFTIPVTPTTPVYSTSHMTQSLKQGQVHAGWTSTLMHTEELAKFQQFVPNTPKPQNHPFDHMQMPHPPNQPLQQQHQLHQCQVHGYGPMYEYTQEYRGYPAGMPNKYGTSLPGNGPTDHLPHPPGSRQTNLGASATFQTPPGPPIGYAGYPYHPMMMAPQPPNLESPKVAHGEMLQPISDVISTPAVSNVEVQTDTFKSTVMDKVTLVEESAFTSVSQIPDNDVKVPHPPSTKKGERPSPRKPVKVQDANRHIDGIRQHHEQRRQEQEESRLTDEEILARQRKFAKASLDRYFNSLENLYNSKPIRTDSLGDMPEEINDEINEERELVEENHNSEEVNMHHANDSPVFVTDSKEIQAEVQVHHSVTDANKQAYFSQFDVGKSVDEETMVNSEVTGVTLNVGGVTDRLEGMGIHVSHDQLHSNGEETGHKKQTKQGKRLLVCPECEGLNKEYMSWCTHCGEMIIGVEPKLVSKTRDGKLRIKPVVDDTEPAVAKLNHINSNKKPVEVNYIQELADKPFSLNLEELKSDEKEHYVETKNTSPIKSDGKDSGRPSSDDRENELHGQMVGQEAVDNICETITDPVVQGYVRSHLTKQHTNNKAKEYKDSNLKHSDKKKDFVKVGNTPSKQYKVADKNFESHVLKENSHNIVTSSAHESAKAGDSQEGTTDSNKISVAERVKMIESEREAKLKVDFTSAQKNTPLLKGDLAMDSIGASYLIMSKKHNLVEASVDKDMKESGMNVEKGSNTSVFELSMDTSDTHERTALGLDMDKSDKHATITICDSTAAVSNKPAQSFTRDNAFLDKKYFNASVSHKETSESIDQGMDAPLPTQTREFQLEESESEIKNMDHNDNIVPPMLPNFSTHVPVNHSELALKLPVDSMDFSMDYSQTASMNYEALDEFKTEEEMKAIKEEKKRERRRKRGHGAIDVEVFGIEEMRESRNSSRDLKLVPVLNLAGNSSDEDDFSIQSDTKSDMKSDICGEPVDQPPLNCKVTSSVNAWEMGTIPEQPQFDLDTPTDAPKVLTSPDNSARPLDAPSQTIAKEPPRHNNVTDSNEDWKILFDPTLDNEPEEVLNDHDDTESLHQPFLEHIMQQEQEPVPVKSKNRPKSTKSKPIKSKVRQSLEETNYQRKWDRSSTAWSSYNSGELKTSSSLRSSTDLSRPSSAPKIRNHSNMTSKGQDNQTRDTLPVRQPVTRSKRPFSADMNKRLSRSTSDLSRSLQPSPSTSQRNRDVSPYRSTSKTGHCQSNNLSRNEASPDLSAERQEPARDVIDSFNEPEKQDITNGMHQYDTQAGLESRSSVAKETTSFCLNLGSEKRPSSASKSRGKQPKQKKKSGNHSNDIDLSVDLVTVEHRLPKPGVLEWLSDLISAGSPKSTYDKYLEMTPRIEAGTMSKWQCLPDEILLHVFAYLDQTSLTTCAQVCHQFYRVAMDESLWKYITIKKRNDLDDSCLLEISKRHPVSLALIQCQGEQVTAKGLRDLFRECSSTLKELNISRCSKGALQGDSLLLHAAARCTHITHVDTSWCSVTDSGLMAISNTVHRLESLIINGCQAISDDGLETIIKKHGSHLRALEMFGCFNLTPRGLRCISNNCINLLSINLGNCYKLTDSCIAQLSASLGRVETLDLRGCKQIKDNSIRRVVKNCPRLKSLSLANCQNITDVSLLEISTYLTDIRSIDLCGCKKVTDSSIRALVNTCTNLREIDISSTGCTHRSVSMIANFSGQRLETLKINFLSDVTEQSLIKLAKHCRRLKAVHMYGCPSVRNMHKIQEERPTFTINM